MRNETFDRYQLFNCKQEINEPLEKFHSRNQRIVGKFSQQNIADPIGTLQYALARERGQENQQKMNNNNNIDTKSTGTTEVHYVRRNNIKQRTGILPTPKTGLIRDCWKCGLNFVPGHLISCQAKQEICRVCKKTGHFAKMCKAEKPPQSTQRTHYKNNTQNRNSQTTYQYTSNQNNTRRVRNIHTTPDHKLEHTIRRK